MFPHKLLIMTAALVTGAAAQQIPAQQPQVKVNVLHVCTPSADDQKELSSALAKAPGKPAFSKDYEVSRGHSTLDTSTPIPGMPAMPPGTTSYADWVRVRREFPDGTFFSNIQYSFSVDEKNMVETLVLHVRDAKDLMQVSIEDSASTVASAAAMLSSNTPVARVKLERFGKASVVLARCGGEDGGTVTDQTKYEPIFTAASSIMERYRDAIGARKMVPSELARLGVGASPASSKKTSAGDKKQP